MIDTNNAIELMKKGCYDGAIEIFLNQKSNMYIEFRNYGNLAYCYLMKNDLEKALEEFHAARNSERFKMVSVPECGAVLWMQGKVNEAVDFWLTEMERVRNPEIAYADVFEIPVFLYVLSIIEKVDYIDIATKEIKKYLKRKRRYWGSYIGEYIIGQIDADELRRKANEVLDKGASSQNFEANVYIYLKNIGTTDYRELIADGVKDLSKNMFCIEKYILRERLGMK